MSGGIDISQFMSGTAEAQARVIAAAKQALDVAGEHVIGQAQQLCPVDTGALQASGTTEPATESGGKMNKTIGFNTDYAAAVHERLDQNHKRGQAKFLESAMRHNTAKVNQFVNDAVKETLG